MASYKFTAAERYAVFTAHGERCWLCGEPAFLSEIEVDHIVPETLLGKPELAQVLSLLGLPASFQINSFQNWMPAHRRCNRKKSALVFKATPLIQAILQQAEAKAERAEKLHDTYVTDRKITRAINILLAAQEIGELKRHRPFLRKLEFDVAEFHEANRDLERRGKPLMLAPWLEVVDEDQHWLMLRGPSGMVGGRPKVENLDPSWDCPRCGVTAWNGARCVTCGMLDDGD